MRDVYKRQIQASSYEKVFNPCVVSLQTIMESLIITKPSICSQLRTLFSAYHVRLFESDEKLISHLQRLTQEEASENSEKTLVDYLHSLAM